MALPSTSVSPIQTSSHSYNSPVLHVSSHGLRPRRATAGRSNRVARFTSHDWCPVRRTPEEPIRTQAGRRSPRRTAAIAAGVAETAGERPESVAGAVGAAMVRIGAISADTGVAAAGDAALAGDAEVRAAAAQ